MLAAPFSLRQKWKLTYAMCMWSERMFMKRHKSEKRREDRESYNKIFSFKTFSILIDNGKMRYNAYSNF